MNEPTSPIASVSTCICSCLSRYVTLLPFDGRGLFTANSPPLNKWQA